MMDTSLDEDFVNFESVAQRASHSPLVLPPDEEISYLDKEARQRDEGVQGEKDNNEAIVGMKPPSQGLVTGSNETPEYHLFTTFSYNSTSKRLTMIPVKYKVKEERRKVLKISVNKLKKIDDPESWLCRSVLINNTMKKLQKETRDEKINKQMNSVTYFKHCVSKSETFGCPNNNNNNNNNNISNNNNKNNESSSNLCRSEVSDETGCFYQKDNSENEFFKESNSKTEEFLFEVEKSENKKNELEQEKLSTNVSIGVSINEDFVEKIPSIKRCASRKKSLDEDGTANEILNLNDDLLTCNEPKPPELDDVDDCDVHDVLSQLYMPPTPRMLTSIDSDTDDDELNVVDIDSSYISPCPKLPEQGMFDGDVSANEKRRCEDTGESESPAKKSKVHDVFGCFNEENYNFLCSNKCEEKERTSAECKESGKSQEDEVIELEDEEDIKRRLSQSLSTHYHRKLDKASDSFFDDGCDHQYSCGHTATMFSDIQAVAFHNLIASLET